MGDGGEGSFLTKCAVSSHFTLDRYNPPGPVGPRDQQGQSTASNVKTPLLAVLGRGTHLQRGRKDTEAAKAGRAPGGTERQRRQACCPAEPTPWRSSPSAAVKTYTGLPLSRGGARRGSSTGCNRSSPGPASQENGAKMEQRAAGTPRQQTSGWHLPPVEPLPSEHN